MGGDPIMPQSKLARIVASVCLALGLVILAMVAWTLWVSEPQRPQADIGGSFELVNTEGETVTDRDFHGSYTLVFFGFTHCPDICPMTLTHVTQALTYLEERAPAKAERVTPIFVTVDPERDDVETMRTYVGHFHPRLVGLTGSEAQVSDAAEAFLVYHEKEDPDTAETAAESPHGSPGGGEAEAANAHAGEHDGYMVQHSSLVYLMGPDGGYIDHVSHMEGATGIADMLRTHVRE